MLFLNAERIRKAENDTMATTKEERTRRRLQQQEALELAAASGTLLYGPGIDDSM